MFQISTTKRKRSSDAGSPLEDLGGRDVSVLSDDISQKVLQLHPALFKDNSLSEGGRVKAKGEVLREHSTCSRRPPNMNCRVESFGRICQKFDDMRRKWVYEMGFGGLLHFARDMHLPRQLAYWLMTRVDPINKLFISPEGREYRLSKNQVRWILGIPCGSKPVPSLKNMTSEVRGKAQQILLKYGKSWETKSCRERGLVYTSVGIPVTSAMKDRLEGHFEANEEEEFKSLFLIIALQMVLCPTQSPRLASDLIPALGCVMDTCDFDWCDLVLSKLMDSVSSFGRRFYANGFAGGCGGCAMYLVIYYLDRLNRVPIEWGVFPRIKVWSMKLIRKAGKSDRVATGDYGKSGFLDVAYGEHHPKEARDTEGPQTITKNPDMRTLDLPYKQRRRKPPTSGHRGNHANIIKTGV